LFDTFQKYFDVDKLTKSEEGKSESLLIKEVKQVLDTDFFLDFCEMVRLRGCLLERTAHRLEGCECHAEVWKSRSSFKRKQAAMRKRTGYSTCFWKGRQACWFQVDGLSQLCDELVRASSDLLEGRLRGMEPGRRAALLRLQTRLVESLVEELRDNLHFHSQIPYSIIKIFIGEIDDSRTDEARQFVRAVTEEFDKLVLAGKGDKIHRAAWRVLDPKGECRQQLDRFANSDQPLRCFPIAWLIILQYALIPCVGRRVEGVHGQIKRLGFLARNAQPPFISAALNLEMYLMQMREDVGFHRSAAPVGAPLLSWTICSSSDYTRTSRRT